MRTPAGAGIEAMGFACQGTVPSPLRGAKEGNVEFLSAFEFVNAAPLPADLLRSVAAADDDEDSGAEAAEGERTQ